MLTPNLSVDFHNLDSRFSNIFSKIKQSLKQKALHAAISSIVLPEARKLAPKHIAEFIQVSDVTENGNTYLVNMHVSLADAPDAAAWEFGSGLHRTRGSPGKYIISATNAPNLYFWWERESKYFRGKVVHHPGIVARPYMRPALESKMSQVKKYIHDIIVEDIQVR